MIKPLYDRILLEEISAESTTASGIYLPESKEKPSQARVVAVGSQTLDCQEKAHPVEIKIGDTVIYKQYATTEGEYNQKKYLIVDIKDILAIVEEDK